MEPSWAPKRPSEITGHFGRALGGFLGAPKSLLEVFTGAFGASKCAVLLVFCYIFEGLLLCVLQALPTAKLLPLGESYPSSKQQQATT